MSMRSQPIQCSLGIYMFVTTICTKISCGMYCTMWNMIKQVLLFSNTIPNEYVITSISAKVANLQLYAGV